METLEHAETFYQEQEVNMEESHLTLQKRGTVGGQR
jgi:hypothetical protein